MSEPVQKRFRDSELDEYAVNTVKRIRKDHTASSPLSWTDALTTPPSPPSRLTRLRGILSTLGRRVGSHLGRLFGRRVGVVLGNIERGSVRDHVEIVDEVFGGPITQLAEGLEEEGKNVPSASTEVLNATGDVTEDVVARDATLGPAQPSHTIPFAPRPTAILTTDQQRTILQNIDSDILSIILIDGIRNVTLPIIKQKLLGLYGALPAIDSELDVLISEIYIERVPDGVRPDDEMVKIVSGDQSKKKLEAMTKIAEEKRQQDESERYWSAQRDRLLSLMPADPSHIPAYAYVPPPVAATNITKKQKKSHEDRSVPSKYRGRTTKPLRKASIFGRRATKPASTFSTAIPKYSDTLIEPFMWAAVNAPSTAPPPPASQTNVSFGFPSTPSKDGSLAPSPSQPMIPQPSPSPISPNKVTTPKPLHHHQTHHDPTTASQPHQHPTPSSTQAAAKYSPKPNTSVGVAASELEMQAKTVTGHITAAATASTASVTAAAATITAQAPERSDVAVDVSAGGSGIILSDTDVEEFTATSAVHEVEHEHGENTPAEATYVVQSLSGEADESSAASGSGTSERKCIDGNEVGRAHDGDDRFSGAASTDGDAFTNIVAPPRASHANYHNNESLHRIAGTQPHTTVSGELTPAPISHVVATTLYHDDQTSEIPSPPGSLVGTSDTHVPALGLPVGASAIQDGQDNLATPKTSTERHLMIDALFAMPSAGPTDSLADTQTQGLGAGPHSGLNFGIGTYPIVGTDEQQSMNYEVGSYFDFPTQASVNQQDDEMDEVLDEFFEQESIASGNGSFREDEAMGEYSGSESGFEDFDVEMEEAEDLVDYAATLAPPRFSQHQQSPMAATTAATSAPGYATYFFGPASVMPSLLPPEQEEDGKGKAPIRKREGKWWWLLIDRSDEKVDDFVSDVEEFHDEDDLDPNPFFEEFVKGWKCGCGCLNNNWSYKCSGCQDFHPLVGYFVGTRMGRLQEKWREHIGTEILLIYWVLRSREIAGTDDDLEDRLRKRIGTGIYFLMKMMREEMSAQNGKGKGRVVDLGGGVDD
ncbi:hypothetical protein HK097_003431, partial [Rhizophlyctis rosea]